MSISFRTTAAKLQQHVPHCFARPATASEASLSDAPLFEPSMAMPEEPKTVRIDDQLCEIWQPSRAEGLALAGQVALVTGAASGLGKAVALALHTAGAHVAFADLDLAGAEAICAALGERAIAVKMNVTQEDDVVRGFDQVITTWGRLDCLACCAGIAPSAPLIDFDLKAWELSLAINLTGYFLCGREAARIMTAQGHGGSMVLLSSKSGLEPSKNNSPYNATKAGEIHLARGWALELGGAGIRVNCIAPGNVFKGSKIWNDEYIEACAIKKGIAPAEVIPHYIGLTALNQEIEPEDIGNTAVYLASPAARRMTGQVLVVDAGQVFTR